MKLPITLLAAASLGVTSVRAATVTWQTTTPYRGKLDSPWYQLILSEDVQVEDFEGSVNSSLTISSNARVITEPSVDEDDGVIDGRSPFAKSLTYATPSGTPTMSISFTPNAQGDYPTLAGLVFLGFGNQPNGVRRLTAYDSSGNVITPDISGDVPFFPDFPDSTRIGDRFYGFYHSGGISRIETFTFVPRNIDHVQWGWGVPEPGSACLTLAGAALILARRRR